MVGHDTRSVLRLCWSLFLGNVVEWYEFAVYGFLATYLEDQFFHGSALATWLGFGVTFFARPFGGLFFGMMSDAFGRGVALNLSMIGMLIGTAGQGCLPTYASGSNALGTVGLVFLVLLRLVQGLCTAGEISSIATYIAEVGEAGSLGRSMSLIGMTQGCGFLLAQAVVFLLRRVLGEEALAAWGWRVPFVLTLAPGLVAIWGRRKVPESGAYLAEKEKQAARAAAPQPEALEAAEVSSGGDWHISNKHGRTTTAKSMIFDHWRNIAIGMGGIATSGILQYGVFVWIDAYLTHHGMSPHGVMFTGLTARILMLAFAFPVGWLTDRKGVAWLHFVGGLLTAALSVPVFHMLDVDPTNIFRAVMLVGIGFGFLGCVSMSTYYFFVVELFPTEVRGAAVGLSYNLGLGVFGGLAPLVMQASLSVSPKYGPGIVLSLGGLLTSSTIFVALVLQRRGTVKLAHIRAEPYFASTRWWAAIGDASVTKEQNLGSTTDGSACGFESNATEDD